MTAAFADSSALVKLYADEAGHEVVRDLDDIVVSQLARVEVPAAIWRKNRVGDLSAADAATLVANFEADYYGTDEDEQRFAVVSVTARVLDEAVRLVARHALRAYDAVQLASATAAMKAAEVAQFACFDGSLSSAAAIEGMDLLPVR